MHDCVLGKITEEFVLCPICGEGEDGRTMIGCDKCYSWLHWAYAGISSAPAEGKWHFAACNSAVWKQYY